MKIALLAGESSGDLLGAQLINQLRAYDPDILFEGIGGPAMIAAGCKSLFDMERLNVMGLVEPLFRLPDLIKLRRELYHHFTKHRPDVFIGIDAPAFNTGLECKLRQSGIPVVHYVSPSVWAWRQNRIKKIKKAVDLMLTLFPFEAKFYHQHQIPVRYVGHPLAREIPLLPDKLAARRALNIPDEGTYIALMPGSRRQEIQHMAEPFLQGALQAWKQKPHLRFLTTHINQERCEQFKKYHQYYTNHLPLQFFIQRSKEVMAAADIVLVTSGTATLETMLYKNPMIIAYRMPWLTYQIAKWLVKTPHIGLPNLLANERLVTELIQEAVTPTAIAAQLLHYIDHPETVAALQARFADLHRELQVNSTDETVNAIMELIKK